MIKFEERESVVLESDGQKIFGVLHRPLPQKKAPAVVLCHGLAGQKTGKYRLYVILAEQLAAAGIAALRIDFRGCGDSEGEFEQLTVASQTEDALTALDYLKKRPEIDHQRVGVFGRSFGGSVALLAAKQFPGTKSVALWAPIFDGSAWMDKWNQVKAGKLTKEQIGRLMVIHGQQAGYAFFEQMFSMNIGTALDAILKIPLLHIQGDKDIVVDSVQREKYRESRKSATAESRFIALPNSDHDFSYLPERLQAVEATVEWFKITL